MQESETMSSIEQKKLQSRQRAMEKQCYYALCAEAFLISISSNLAIIALIIGVIFLDSGRTMTHSNGSFGVICSVNALSLPSRT